MRLYLPQNCTEKAVIDPQLDTFSYVDKCDNVQTPFFLSVHEKKGLKLTHSPMCHVDNHIFFNTYLSILSHILFPSSYDPV